MFKINSDIPFSPKKWPFFYGYFIVACSAIGFIMSAPGQTIGVSVFTDSLIQALGISRFQLSLAYMLGTIGSSLVIRKAGRLLDTMGVRTVTIGAAALFALVLVFMSRLDHISTTIAGFLGLSAHVFVTVILAILGFWLMRFSGQGVLALSSRTMLMRWFDKLRGRMNAIVGMCISLTFSASPLFFEYLINKHDWRGAWLILAALLLGFTVFVFLFYRDKPEDCGLLPDGHVHRETDSDTETGVEKNWTLHETTHTFTFWVFNIGLSMFSLFLTAITFHVVSIFSVSGMDRQDAISIFLPTAFVSVALNLLSGWMADHRFFRNRMKYMLFIMLSGLFLSGLGVLTLFATGGKYLIILGNGIAQGFFGTLTNVVWPQYFGREHLGEIAGFNLSFLVFFSAIGPPVFGWSFDVTGNYGVSIVVCLTVLFLLLLLTLRADKPGFKRTADD
ncbi:MAG: MFS transporter [candidate division KSB1 bacterium]|nr:MFS transporter [candidate division KSB1 bacterium]